jgi:cobalamin-dependent methionine synthase I
VDWSNPKYAPVTPKQLGTKVWADFPIEDVIKYIDWNPFFQARPAPVAAAWQIDRAHRAQRPRRQRPPCRS